MGVGRRMKKQGMPPTVEDLKIGRKRKSTAQDVEPTKLVKLDRRMRESYKEKADAKAAQRTPPKKKARLVNDDAQVTVPPPMPAAAEEDEIEEELSENLSEAAAVPLPDGSDATSKSGSQSAEDSDSVMASDDDRPTKQGMFSEDEDSEAMDILNAANIEGLSRKLDSQKAQIEEEAQQELEDAALQTNIIADTDLLDSADPNSLTNLTPDLKLIYSRIAETVRVLTDFSRLSDKSRSRATYTQQLITDICIYYNYTPYLAEKLYNLFSPQEALAFFEANERPRPLVIRTNTLRTNRRTLAQSLINRGVQLAPVGKWSKIGLQIYEAQVPLGATPEYLAGHYILQAASSFLPVMALDPQPNERILDMAAAPGGKTTHIAAMMRNTGTIFANDSNKSRAKGLIGNIHRLGCKNVIVCSYQAEKAFPTTLGGFDRVLLDAPCSGTGVIAKDPSVKTSKTHTDFLALPDMQKKLLLAAIDSVDDHSNTGGVMIYSTCSVTIEENESVVEYALRKRPNIKLVDTGLGGFGTPGFTSYAGKQFNKDMGLTRRYFPHRENVDGFFVSKFKKFGPTPSRAAVNGDARPTNGASVEGNGVSAVSGTDSESAAGVKVPNGEQADGFADFNSDEDRPYLEKAEKKWRKSKGLDPRAISGKKGEKKVSKVDEEPAISTTAKVEEKSNGKKRSKEKHKSKSKDRAKL